VSAAAIQHRAKRDPLQDFRELNDWHGPGVLVGQCSDSGQIFIVCDRVSRKHLAEWWNARLAARAR
jgi:hypothetical protein